MKQAHVVPIGIPSEIYTYGTSFVITMIGVFICVLITAEIWIPILYNLQLVSVYDYFYLRYGSKFPTRLMGGIFVLKVSIFYSLLSFLLRYKDCIFYAALYHHFLPLYEKGMQPMTTIGTV